MQKGKVYIIGVGPGDYKLLTIKALECIKKADAIVYDRLIGSQILNYAKKGAELIYVGKLPDCHQVPQDEINRILLSLALSGKNVARVKGGDPFVFGRGGEEAEVLKEHEVEFEIVPGVTSAIAVPAYAGIPVTHRDFCSSFHVITGHEREDKENSLLDYKVLANTEGTLIFLMGVKNLSEICKELVQNGKSSSTPAAVIEKGTTMDQRVVIGTLDDITEKVTTTGIHSPAVTVIGNVVGLREQLNWFPYGKLAGKRVLVTRSRDQASKLVEKIEELGGEAIEFPTIRIERPLDFTEFDNILGRIHEYQWLVFTSTNGVKAFFERMKEVKIDIRSLYGIKICAVGEATSKELCDLGINIDFMPENYTTEELMKGLLERVSSDEKVLLARADIAAQDLPEGLRNKKISVDVLTTYRTVMEDTNKENVLRLLMEQKVDFITFTSSSTVKNFVSLVGGEVLKQIKLPKIVCIGPVTLKTAQELGFIDIAMSDKYTIDGLVEKMIHTNSR